MTTKAAAQVVLTTEQERRIRRRLAFGVLAALLVGACGFGYAIFANERTASNAQTTADQAKAQNAYGLALVCRILHAEIGSSSTPRADLPGLRHFFEQLACEAILEHAPPPLPRVPGATPPSRAGPATATPRATATAAGAPSPSASASPSPTPTRPRPTPTHSPPPTPKPTPSTCVTPAGVTVCLPRVALTTAPG